MAKKMKISTSWAWLITLTIAVGMVFWKTFHPTAPVEALYVFMGTIGGAYGFRRYKLKINGGK